MADEDELRRRLELLREQMEAGRIVVAEHLADGVRESLTDAPKLNEIPGEAREILREKKDLRRSPMGLLFRHKK